uniref:Uncharacterized protein n=1 Tax=viral metagenome TaxID=1070528 RepID=A0A6M3KYT5_9ZZZZ
MNKQEYQTLLAQCAASMSGNILFPRINEIDMKEVASDAVCAAKALLKEVGIEEEEDIDGIKIACREAFPNQTK